MNELGKWITNNTKSPFYARKEIYITKAIKKACINICGLGQFALYINGEKVGNHELDPGWTNYRKLIQYVSFNLENYLTQGVNVIGAEVGNGWYIKSDENYTFKFPEFMPPNPNPYTPFGGCLVLALRIDLEYTDGTADVILSDESFKVKKHPVIMSNVYGSETIDGRFYEENWCNRSFEAREWDDASLVSDAERPKGNLQKQLQPAVKVIHSFQGRYLHKRDKMDIYDFGQNMAAIIEFSVKGRKGDVIRIYPAEKLDSAGNIDQMAKGWMNIDSCITYILGKDDEWETFRMHFTYFSGRYAGVKNIPSGRAHTIEVRELTAYAISSAPRTNGTFECDDIRFLQIYDLVEKAVEANLLSVHTDCPTIERFAWEEINHLMAPSIMYMKEAEDLWNKFFLDMRTDQITEDDCFLDMDGKKFNPGVGLVPSQCPCYIPNVVPVPGIGSFYDVISWGSASILGPYWHYLFYGKVKVIEDNYEMGKKYLKHLRQKVNEEGFINHGLGDWGNPENDFTKENIETAFLYADVKVMCGFAKELGYENDWIEYKKWAEGIRENYNKKLLVYDEKNDFWCYRAWDYNAETYLTQGCQALPLYWGMVPEAYEQDVTRALEYTLRTKGGFSCGEVSQPYIIQSAAKYGMNDLICDYILKPEHPSYYAFILDGETTLGEYWEKNPRSHCHDMMGHIIEWYYNSLAGIIPLKPGFKEVLIRPYLPKSMNEITCTYKSANGSIHIQIQKKENQIVLNLDIDERITYKVDTTNLETKGCKVVVDTVLPGCILDADS